MGPAYLALLIACGSGLTLSCKWANRKGSSPLGLVTVVQVTSLVVLAVVALVCGRSWPHGLIWLALGAGVGGAVGFLLNIQALEIGHYAFTGAITGASFLVSVLFSALFWERLGRLQVAGIAALTVAVVLLAFSGAADGPARSARWGKWVALVAGSFFLYGLAQISNAAAVRKFAPAGPPLLEFMTVIYAVGALVLLPVNLRKGEFSRRTVLYGSLGAASSLLGTVANLQALRYLPPSVVFPVSVSGGLLVALLLSRLLFREKIGRLGYAGVAVEVVGVALIAAGMTGRASP